MDSISDQHQDIISLRQILFFFWRWKLVLVGLTFCIALASVAWVLSLPNEYEASVLIVPSESDSAGGLANLAGQFGGLASLAGVNIGGDSGGDSAVALDILQSRDFVMGFIEKYNLLPALIAVERWDSESNTLVFKSELYDAQSKKWNESTFQEGQMPTPWNGFNLFINRLSISQGSDSGVISVSFEHYSPTLSVEVVENLVKEINEKMRASAMQEAEKSIVYLQQEISKTQVAELKSVFYSLVEEQTKNLMLAKVRDDYIFKIVSDAVLPEDKSSPRRGFLVIILTFFGFISALLISLVLDALNIKSAK